MDKVRDAMEDHQDITNAISQPLAMDGLDDDELLEELNALENEELDKEMLGLNDEGIAAPTVGKQPLPGERNNNQHMHTSSHRAFLSNHFFPLFFAFNPAQKQPAVAAKKMSAEEEELAALEEAMSM